MKRYLSVTLCLCLVLSFLTACGGTVQPAGGTETEWSESTAQTGDGEKTLSLKEPVMNWWYIKTNTGIPTLLAEFKNENEIGVDAMATLRFYKGDEEIKVCEDWPISPIGSGEKRIMFGTDVPESADRLELEYVYLAESSYNTYEAKAVSDSARDGYVDVTYECDGEWEEGMTVLIFYSGDTIVAYGAHCFFTGDELCASYQVIENYDRYDIYTNFYSYK